MTVNFCRSCKVDMTKGYLFRIVSENGSLLDKPVSYSVFYQRLRHYLTTLGIYDGETPHSFRAGCAITMALTNAVENVEGVMNHIGWFSQESDRKHSSRFYYCCFKTGKFCRVSRLYIIYCDCNLSGSN